MLVVVQQIQIMFALFPVHKLCFQSVSTPAMAPYSFSMNRKVSDAMHGPLIRITVLMIRTTAHQTCKQEHQT